MPDSRLVEKLEKLLATIHEGGPKNCTCRLEHWVGGPVPCITCQFKDAEKELRNLCLELSERLRVISDYGTALQKSYAEATPLSEQARIIGKEVCELAEKEKKA